MSGYEALTLLVPTLVSLVAPEWSATTLAAAPVGVAYSVDLPLTGGAVASVAVASGALPAGLSASVVSDHVIRISGTPAALELAQFTLSATNAGGTATTGELSILTLVTVFNQAFSENKVVDGDMESATTASWVALSGTLSKETTDPFAGARYLRTTSTGGNSAANQYSKLQFGDGKLVEVRAACRSTGTDVTIGDNNGGTAIVRTASASWRQCRTVYRPANNHLLIGTYTNSPAAGQYGEFDEVYVAWVTMHDEETAPGADHQTTLLFDLPSPELLGDNVRLFTRIDDYATGNYWEARLQLQESGWRVELWRVVNFTETLKTSANNIGAVDGIRVTQVGDTHTLQTSSDGGDSWNQRGSTVTGDANHSTATGINVAYTSGFTILSLSSTAAA